MLQGVGSRFDFHINKTLCDLRFVCFKCFLILIKPMYLRTREIFDIIIDFPDSIGALHDLRVLPSVHNLFSRSLSSSSFRC